MSTLESIDYLKFTDLSGLELCHYMEPLIVASAIQISDDVLAQILSNLSTYDEYHLVYAILLGVKYSPDAFVSELPRFLAHEQEAVWSTALNSLEQLPDKYITSTLVDSLQRVHDTYPEKAWVKDIFVKLKKRWGENPEAQRGQGRAIAP